MLIATILRGFHSSTRPCTLAAIVATAASSPLSFPSASHAQQPYSDPRLAPLIPAGGGAKTVAPAAIPGSPRIATTPSPAPARAYAQAQPPATPPAPAAAPSPAAPATPSPAEPGVPGTAVGWERYGASVFVCGHSFHVFIDKKLRALAYEAGFQQHRHAGRLFVGGSHPIEIWNLPDSQNTARAALREGHVDILTLSPHMFLPDRGIDFYADYAWKYNPHVRVMLQLSWPTNPASAGVDWNQMALILKGYMALADAQVKAINARHKADFVSTVPVVLAVMKLREEIIAGRVPGIRAFGDLFTDKLGHAGPALENLVTFCWYAAIYKRSPEGLKALDAPATQVKAETNAALQKIAWAVISPTLPAAPAKPTAATSPTPMAAHR